VQETEKIWMNGELIDWADATVHVGTHGLHYGSGVFEGIRCYDTEKGPAVFRLSDHLHRLQNSARLLSMPLPFTLEDFRTGCLELIQANGLPECYLRPICFVGYGELGVSARGNPIECVIMSWPWGTYLGEEGIKHGVRMKVSSWRRQDPNMIPPAAKVTGLYVNSSLAKVEALKAGYDEAILLNTQGHVSECTGENLFLVKGGRITTPPLSAGALDGITRDSIMVIARDLGYEVVEENILRSDLYIADEAFLTGTAAEVVPIRAVDDRVIGEPGEVTRKIQEMYFATIRGEVETYKGWLEHVRSS
jgi:branched-chain amino acid aminotransferase